MFIDNLNKSDISFLISNMKLDKTVRIKLDKLLKGGSIKTIKKEFSNIMTLYDNFLVLKKKNMKLKKKRNNTLNSYIKFLKKEIKQRGGESSNYFVMDDDKNKRLQDAIEIFKKVKNAREFIDLQHPFEGYSDEHINNLREENDKLQKELEDLKTQKEEKKTKIGILIPSDVIDPPIQDLTKELEEKKKK